MEDVKKFLSAPAENKDDFWESGTLIWVDWGDFDDSMIKYFNDKLPDEDKIQFECAKTEKERGVDIFLCKNGVCTAIPYADDCTDRDTTLKSIQKYVSPKYQIRWYMDSLGDDTLAFCIGLTSCWEQFEQEFGAEQVDYYFAPIEEDSVMFGMDMDEVFDLLEQREEVHGFLQEIRTIGWFEHNSETTAEYHVITSIFEAYDTWNDQMLTTWEPQISLLENMAIDQIGDSKIDEIFSLVSCEIGDIIWKKWGEFISRWHLEKEMGLDNEMMDSVKRDMSWACIEKILNKQGFFSSLLAIYKNGYFPCAWIGDYPDGQAVVL